MLKKNSLKKISKLLAVGVILLTAYFFLRTLNRNWQNIQQYKFQLSWKYAILAIFFLNLAVIASGSMWGKVLEELTGKTVNKFFAIRTHIYAWLLKYIPGKTGLILGKIALGANEGFSKKEVVVSTIYENVFLVIASFLSSVPFLGLLISGSEIKSNVKLFIPTLFTIPLIILIYPPIFYRIVNFGLKSIRKNTLDRQFFLSFSRIVRLNILYLIPRMLNGVGFIFIVKAIIPSDFGFTEYLGMAATFNFASIIGLLAFLTPGGIGVREAVITLLLGNYFSTEVAIMISVVSRLFVTVGDIMLAFQNLSTKYLRAYIKK